jgi:hypothetical protein
MIPRYSITMLGRNFDLVLKVLIYGFVLMLICSALLIAIANPILDALNSNLDFSGRLREILSDFINHENMDVFGQFLQDLNTVVNDISSQIDIAILLMVLVVFFAKFFFSMIDVPLSEVIYGRMSKNFSMKFRNVLVSSLRKALLYSLVNTTVTLIADSMITVLCFYFMRILYFALGPFAIAIAMLIFFGLLSSRMALFGQWVPQMICEKKSVACAFREAFRFSIKYFWKVMPVIFVVNILFFSVVMTTFLFTFGLLPALSIPFVLIQTATLNLVAYHTFNKKKFYVDEVTVVNQIENEEE